MKTAGIHTAKETTGEKWSPFTMLIMLSCFFWITQHCSLRQGSSWRIRSSASRTFGSRWWTSKTPRPRGACHTIRSHRRFGRQMLTAFSHEEIWEEHSTSCKRTAGRTEEEQKNREGTWEDWEGTANGNVEQLVANEMQQKEQWDADFWKLRRSAMLRQDGQQTPNITGEIHVMTHWLPAEMKQALPFASWHHWHPSHHDHHGHHGSSWCFFFRIRGQCDMWRVMVDESTTDSYLSASFVTLTSLLSILTCRDRSSLTAGKRCSCRPGETIWGWYMQILPMWCIYIYYW